MSGKLQDIRLYEKDLIILGEGRRGPYLLPDSLIIENSEKIFLNGDRQSKQSYHIDYIDGEIRFHESVPQDVEIHLIYKVFPYALEKSYANREIHQRVFGAPHLFG